MQSTHVILSFLRTYIPFAPGQWRESARLEYWTEYWFDPVFINVQCSSKIILRWSHVITNINYVIVNMMANAAICRQ